MTTLPPWITPTLPTPTRTTPSGLIVPSGSLATPTAGAIETARPEDLERVTELVAARREQLAAAYGAGAADALLGANEVIAEQVAADIARERIVAAIMAGDLGAALAAAQRR